MARLSLCMIVKDEEECLERCLLSIKDLVDEIVIVDTGSLDRTRDIAASFGARILDFTWCDDFAAARNESIKHATGEWILILDADETIAMQDHETIRAFIARDDAPDGYVLLTRTYQRSGAVFDLVRPQVDRYEEGRGYAGWIGHAIVRLFRNKGFMFRGRVHELIEYSIEEQGGTISQSGIPIHHFGEEKDEERKRSKQEMYHCLQEKKVQECPDDPRALFELGMQCLQEKRPQEARHWLEKSLSTKPSKKTAIALLHVHAKLQENDQALDLYESYFQDGQDERAEFIAARIRYKRKDYAKALAHLGPLIGAGDIRACDIAAKAHLASGRPDEARPILERIADARPQVRYNLALIEYHAGRKDKAIEHLRALLTIDPNHQKARDALEHIQQSL